MTTPITRSCPHCQRPYDISRRMHNDRVWCPCGGWSAVIMKLDGSTYLAKCDAPQGTAPAQETTVDAALLVEMSVMRAELEVVKAEAAALRETLEWRHSCENCHGEGSYWVAINVEEAELETCDCWIRADHVLYHEEYNASKALLAELAAARAVIEALRNGTYSTVEDALADYDQVIKK